MDICSSTSLTQFVTHRTHAAVFKPHSAISPSSRSVPSRTRTVYRTTTLSEDSITAPLAMLATASVRELPAATGMASNQFVDTGARFREHVNELALAAAHSSGRMPLLGTDSFLAFPSGSASGLSILFAATDRHAPLSLMLDSFDSLRHHAIVCPPPEPRYPFTLGAAGASR